MVLAEAATRPPLAAGAGRGHRAEDLIHLFQACFTARYATILVRGEDEPVYRPRQAGQPYHEIVFAHGYFASALHEIAHWCVAGRARRQLADFGYWYQPDGRSAAQQAAFQQVEVQPQAFEWIFSTAADFRFRFSADNLSGENLDMASFREAVHARVLHLLHKGLPRRARMWTHTLAHFYGQRLPLVPQQFSIHAALV